MVEKIIKVDENNVAEIREQRTLHSKQALEQQKAGFEARIARINELLEVLV